MNRILPTRAFAFLLLCARLGFCQADEVPVRGFDRAAYESSFSRAERAGDGAAWMSAAEGSAAMALARWEREAAALYEGAGLFANDALAKNALAKDAALLAAWLDRDLAARFELWLKDRFFGREAAGLRSFVLAALRSSDEQFLYAQNADGSPAFDDAGNPLRLRPGDTASIEADRVERDIVVRTSVGEALERYASRIEALCPELIAHIPQGQRAGYLQAVDRALVAAREKAGRELDALCAREERLFVARRSADIWSLRKKSENESAQIVAEALARETAQACDTEIANLQKRIVISDAPADELTITGQNWLDDFSRQFDRGLAAWKAAEERFMVSRLEWERDSAQSFLNGSKAWADAFGRLSDARRAWEGKAAALLRDGEAAFARASEALDASILAARAGFELASTERDIACAGRVSAWVDVYAQAGAAATSAREVAGYWLSRLGPAAPALTDPGLAGWLRTQSVRVDLGAERAESARRALEALDLYQGYTEKAAEARSSLLNDFNLAMGAGAGSLVDILGDAADSDAFNLDEYQVELIRAKAIEGYWTRRVDVARAVLQYATDLGSGRISEGAGIQKLEAAKTSYERALLDYKESERQLREAGTESRDRLALMEEAMAGLVATNARLEEAQGTYSMLVGAMVSGDASYLKTEFIERYRELVIQSGLSSIPGAPGAASMVAAYLEKAKAMGQADDIERAGSTLRYAVAGKNGEASLSQLSANWKRIVVPAVAPGTPPGVELYGIEPDNAAYASLVALFSDMNRLAAASDSPAAREEYYREYGTRAALIAGRVKAEARAALESRLAAIALITAPDTASWYETIDGHELRMLPGSTLEQKLSADIVRRSRDLLRARTETESAALAIVLGQQATGPQAQTYKHLAAFWSGSKEEASEARAALERLLRYVDNNLGQSESIFNAGIEALAADNSLIASFVRGRGFFNAHGFDAGKAGCASALEALERSRGLYDAYIQYGATSMALEQERLDMAIESLGTVLAELGAGLDKDGKLPQPREIIMALLSSRDGMASSLLSLAEACDKAAGLAPGWMAAEIDGWKNALITCAAAKSLDRGLPPARTSVQLADDMAALRGRLASVSDFVSGIWAGGMEELKSLRLAADSLPLSPREFELVESELSQKMAAILLQNCGSLEALSDEEPDWLLVENALSREAGSRFGFAGEATIRRALSSVLDALRSHNAIQKRHNPDMLQGAALEARCDQIWSQLDYQSIYECAALCGGGLTRSAYALERLVFDQLATMATEPQREDLVAFLEPGASGELGWLERYYASEGQDAGSQMQYLLELACAEEGAAWSLSSARARIDSCIAENLAGVRSFRKTLARNTGGAAQVAERLLAIQIARVSPDAAYARRIFGIIELSPDGDIEAFVANETQDCQAEAFLVFCIIQTT